MGNRSTIEQRSAAGTDDVTDIEKPALSSSRADSSADESNTESEAYASGIEFKSKSNSRLRSSREAQRVVAEYNAATLRKEYNLLEDGWENEFSSVSRSEMTTTDQSNLPSPLTDQSTPFRVPVKKTKSSADGAHTTTSAANESSVPSPSSLSSTDTWYGLPSLIETEEKSELEAFARPGLDDARWIAQTHDYFDNEKVFVKKPSKPTVGRRLRIGRIQRKRWSSIVREMALRHPLPINPAPFPLSKAMDELKLRPEKRFTMPHN